MENKCYYLRYLPIFEQDLISTANYITNVLKNEDAALRLIDAVEVDYDGQTAVVYNSQTNKIESPPSIIVALNGYSVFLKELLQKLN